MYNPKIHGVKVDYAYTPVTGNTHPSAHHDLGTVCRVADGRIGLVQSISYTQAGAVSVGGGFDFGIWQSEVFPAADVQIIGVRNNGKATIRA